MAENNNKNGGYAFRLHNKKNVDTIGKGWYPIIGAYNKAKIDDIPDPSGATKNITSIPSPFARIDLVARAFQKVAGDGNLDGDTIYHKYVSDALDVGEIFFNYNKKYKDRVDIIEWKKAQIEELKNQPFSGQKRLGNTLDLFLPKDVDSNDIEKAKGKDPYNFNDMDSIFLLKLKSTGDIIGATSPASLFFTSANDLSRFSKALEFGEDKPFDKYLQPLYKRDPEYIKFLFTLRKVHKLEFSTKFPEVNEYLEKTFEKLQEEPSTKDSKLNDKLADINNSKDTDSLLSNYEPIDVGGSIHVHILNNDWLLYCLKDLSIEVKSDFVINIKDKALEEQIKKEYGHLPLVLPWKSDMGIEDSVFVDGLNYENDKWEKGHESEYRLKYEDDKSKPIKERHLPFNDIQYPYLTLNDFFEDTIIKNKNGINSDNFFNGDSNPDDSYLMPLKKIVFEFLTIDEIKKYYRLDRREKYVKVSLRIPIKGPDKENTITYSKIYEEKYTKEFQFDLSVIPAIKTSPDVKKIPYIFTFYKEGTKKDYELTPRFLKCGISDEVKINPNEIDNRNKKDGHALFPNCNDCDATTYLIRNTFEFIVLDFEGSKATLIPNIVKNYVEGGKTYRFAVDFGTTNTHIEYKDSAMNEPHPFDINEEEKQIAFYTKIQSEAVKNNAQANLIPSTIGGEKDDVRFPIRTALSEETGLRWPDLEALLQANIPFYYEKKSQPDYNIINTNLKWNLGSTEGKGRAEKFIETLFILMRNKIVMNDGKLKETEVIWFHPSSMSGNDIDILRGIWRENAKHYFGDEVKIKDYNEAIAPYVSYGEAKGNNSVSIDIGGGTSDIYFTGGEDEGPKYISSIRFAADNLFGDSYGRFDKAQNGFVNYFSAEFKKLADAYSKNCDFLSRIGDIMKKMSSTDTTSLFYSLKGNNEIKKAVGGKEPIDFDFNEMMKRTPVCCTLVLLFYSAIIYYVAKISKAKKLKFPRFICLSGNGSRVISILMDDGGDKTKALEKFTKDIIISSKVKDKEDGKEDFKIKTTSEPKRCTCLGGLNMTDSDESKPEQVIWGGYDDTVFKKDGSDAPTIKEINSEKDDYIKKVKDETNKFIEIFKEACSKEDNNIQYYFGAVPPTVMNELYDQLGKNIEQHCNVAFPKGGEEKITDSLFFYHITCVIHDFAQKYLK
jgi:hypothetical protein